MKHVLLVGATDGIGRALADEYLARRWRVGLVGRSPDKLDRVAEELRAAHPRGELSATLCDVTETGRVRPAFEEAVRALGQLDTLVYCAGVMPPYDGGPAERFGAARADVAVNLLGAVAFVELAADYLAGVGKGRIAAIGSVSGERGRKGNPPYGASKAGLHTYLEGLRHRLHGSGVGVTTVKPGWVKTRMLDGEEPPGAIEPEQAARAIADGLEAGREVFFVPGWWRLVSWGLRFMPRALFKRIGPA